MFEQNDDKTILSFIVQNCPVFYFTKEEQNFPLDVEQFLRKCQLKHILTPNDVYCSSIQNLFLEKRYLIQGKTRSPLTDTEFYIQPSRKVNMLNHLTKSIIYTRLTVNSKFIRVSYMMFFKENEGTIHNDEFIGQQHGDWKHVSLYFDKTSQSLMYAVLHNHFRGNEVVSADKLQFETVSGQYRPVFYIAKGTHSIYSHEGTHIDTLCEVTDNGKKWMPRNIVFLPETLQRARRTKSSWVYYRGQYGSDKSYGPVYQPWWNQDPEFITHINDVGMGDFKIRSERIEEISLVIEETTERVRSRVRSQTEVNRSRLNNTISIMNRVSHLEPISLIQKDVLYEKQSIEQEKKIQETNKELELKLKELYNTQEQIKRKQEQLLEEETSIKEQKQIQQKEYSLLQEKELVLKEREQEMNELHNKVQKDIEEFQIHKKNIEEKEQHIKEISNNINQIELREKELETREVQLKEERNRIRDMITDGMHKSQKEYSEKKKELEQKEKELNALQYQLSEKSKELHEVEEQLQEMTETLEERQKYIQTQQKVFETQKEELQKKEEELKKNLENHEKEKENLCERENQFRMGESQLESQIADLHKQIDAIQTEASSSMSSLKEKYENELENVKKSLQSGDTRIHQLEVLLQSAKEQQKESKKEKTIQEEIIGSLKTSLEESLQKEKELKENVQSLETQLTAQTQIVNHMSEELETTEKKLINSVNHEDTKDMSIGAKVSLVLQQREQEIQNLHHYIKTIETKVQTIETTKNDSTIELERIKSEFNELECKYQEEIEDKLKTQEELTTLLEKVQEEVIELNNQLETQKTKEIEWKRKYEHIRQQHTSTEEEQRKVYQQLTLLSKEHSELRKVLHSKTQELDILKQTKEELEKNIQDVEDIQKDQVENQNQRIKSIEEECSKRIQEAHDVLQTHQATIQEQSKKLENQRQHMEKQKQELNTRMTRMIDKADLVQSQVRVTELQQALEVLQRENSVNCEQKEKFEKTVSEQQQRLRYMETQADEWKKHMESMEQIARTTEQKYTRIVQEVERYKAREKDMISREQSMEAQKREWENQLVTLRGTHEEQKKELQKQLDQLVHLKQTEQRKHVSAKSAPSPAPTTHVGNLMFTQTRAPVIGRRRQKAWIRR